MGELLSVSETNAISAISASAGASVSPIRLGVFSTGLIVALTMVYSSYYDLATYLSWVAFIWMTAVPAQIVLGLHMRFGHPVALANLPQPLKGLAFSGITLVLMFLSFGYLYLVAGGMTVPGPFLIMQTIVTIVATFWLVAAWQCWPFTTISKNPLMQGFMAFVASFALGHLVFHLSFDFSFMANSPGYVERLDPKGVFDAWYALAFSVTTVAVIMLLSLFDNWPLTKVSAAQPWLGLMISLTSLTLGAITMWFAVTILEMDPVDYLVRLPVSVIFGVFLVTNMMQFQLFSTQRQPMRGIRLLVVTLVLAYSMQLLYRRMGDIVVGAPLSEGAPLYEMELWVATALLSITFPLINFVSGYFAFWPFRR